ncbi:MAG TPA: nitrous oxide reductase family maturation protein NosD [Thermoanaerobaculia bacterium]|nr:nitrous oxide reductase family maturation protein NosD [Thermoanaerobaculia bacterium]
MDGHHFRRAAAGLTLLAAAALAGVTGAAEIAVAPGELEPALRAARPGDTLKLLAGIHRGPIELGIPLRLIGEPGAILDGDGRGTVVLVRAPGVEIADLRVRGGGADLGQDDAAIRFDRVEGGAVLRCHVEARGFGIYLAAGGSHRIEGNVIEGDAGLPVARRGNGIHLWHTERNEILDNELASVRDGVYLSFAHDNLIRGNQGERLRYGIHYMYSERNTLMANRFTRCTGGIALMFSFDNHIEANVTAGNARFGILLQQLERSKLVANLVTGNGRGFYLENSAANRFERNHMEANGVGAYLTAGSEGNVFTANHFDGNLVQVYRNHAGRNAWWDAGRGNRWSDYAGFDWSGDGIGDTPYRLETSSSALIARRPRARWLWMSPLLALLDWWDLRWLDSGAVGVDAFDRFPLVGDEVAAPPLAASVAGRAGGSR